MRGSYVSVCAWLIVMVTFLLQDRPVRSEETNQVVWLPETNSLSSPGEVSMQEIQEQLRLTQLALERGRKEAELAATRNNELLMGRLESLERALANDRSRDLNLLQGFQRTMLILAGAATLIALIAVGSWAYFQWRSFNRLAEISAEIPRTLALNSVRTIARLPLGDPPYAVEATELPGSPLQETIDKLEKRVRELELTEPQVLPEPGEATAAASSGSMPSESGQNGPDSNAGHVELLLAKGQSLLSLNQAPEALQCFEEALAIAPARAEVLVKKGQVLEQLGRMDEAIGSYDQAIAVNSSLTLAYLHKGGLFNRLQRFNEALECYEQALGTATRPSKAAL